MFLHYTQKQTSTSGAQIEINTALVFFDGADSTQCERTLGNIYHLNDSSLIRTTQA